MREDHSDDLEISLRPATRDVVNGSRLPFFESESNGVAEVLHEEPIALLHAISIDGNRFVLKRIGDRKRNEFFRKLKWPVIIGATKNDRRNTISVRVR